MRSVAEYLKLADQYTADAEAETQPSLRKRFADIAECYRLLARERQRLIASGTIASDQDKATQ